MRPHDKRSDLMKKAVSSKNLTERAEGNALYAAKDFNGWARSLIDSITFSSVLDICCGTGNQLAIYAGMPRVDLIAGVDISEQAIATARGRIAKAAQGKKMILKACAMEEMFSDPALDGISFGLISCFYGLYYSLDVKKTLGEAIRHVPAGGSLLIVGPYGKNNAAFFDLLSRHMELPKLVVHSSTVFMEQDVFPVLAVECEVERSAFVNEIYYPSAKALIDYWRASTFYFPQHEEVVAKDVEDHFSRQGNFVVEKHILAYKARKRG